MKTTDEQLLCCAAEGDEEAVAAFYRRWAPLIRQLAVGVLQNVDDAEDVVQEAFYAVFAAVKGGRGPHTSAVGYLYTVARHIACRQRARNEPLVGVGLPIRGSDEPGWVDREERSVVAAAFAGLPRRWRDVLWLIEVEGYTPVELAPALAATPNAVSSLATRARRAFRTAYWHHARAQPRSRRSKRGDRSAGIATCQG